MKARGGARIRIGLTIGVVAATAAVTLESGRTEEPKAPPAPLKIEERVAVHLVQMSIIATDRQGRPINDLKPGEIQAAVGRRSLKVAYLEAVSRPAPQDRPASPVRLHLDAPGGWSDPAGAGTGEPRYVAFFIDVENDAPTLRQESSDATAAFVRSRLRAGDRASVFSYDGTLNLELPFTDDREALAGAILSASFRNGRPRIDPAARTRSLVRSMEACVQSASQFEKSADPQCLRDVANEYSGEVNAKAQDFVRALQDLVRYLGGLEGRKSVIALSHGLPVDPAPVILAASTAVFGASPSTQDLQRHVGFGTGARPQMDRLLDTLVQNRVALHFLDRVPPPSGDFQASRGEMLTAGAFPARAEYDAAAEDMNQAASYSGGVRIASTDVGDGLGRIVDLLDASYDLGLETDEYLDAKQLKKVEVSCSRKGVKLLRSRGAYSPRPLEEQVLRGRFVLGKPAATGEAPHVTVRQPFRLEVDPKELDYRMGDKEAQASFTIHLAVLSETSGRLADTFHFVSHGYDAEVWRSGAAAPVTFVGWIEARPGNFILRAHFRNVDTGKEGTVSGSIVIAATRESSGTGAVDGDSDRNRREIR